MVVPPAIEPFAAFAALILASASICGAFIWAAAWENAEKALAVAPGPRSGVAAGAAAGGAFADASADDVGP